jgi:glutamate/aspartate transport system permease protein
MLENFDFNVIERALPYLFFVGMKFTLTLTVLAASGALILGTVLAMIRISAPKVFALPVIGYVNLMRSLPFLLVIFWFYFLVPYIGQWITGASTPVRVGAFNSTLITFILFEGAFFSEIMRAGIQSIPKGQVAAGYAMGMTYAQVMWNVVLPQAFRNMLPALLTQTIVLFQDTSLVYVLSLTDFLGAASKIAQRDQRLVEMYIFAALVYFLVSFSMSLLVKNLHARISVPR